MATSTGDRYTITATNDYPSSDSFALMAEDEGAGGLWNIEGQASFVLTEHWPLRARPVGEDVVEWGARAVRPPLVPYAPEER